MNALADYQQLFSIRYAAAPNRRASAGGSAQLHRNIATSRDRLITNASIAFVAEGMSDMRIKKVAALRQAIAAGTYSVSAADLADKLIGSMRRISK